VIIKINAILIRYHVNEKEEIVVIGENVDLIEKKWFGLIVVKELYNNFFFGTAFLYLLGWYDEEADSVFYFVALKVIDSF